MNIGGGMFAPGLEQLALCAEIMEANDAALSDDGKNCRVRADLSDGLFQSEDLLPRAHPVFNALPISLRHGIELLDKPPRRFRTRTLGKTRDELSR